MPRYCTISVGSQNEHFRDVIEQTSQVGETDKKYAIIKNFCFLRVNQDEKNLGTEQNYFTLQSLVASQTTGALFYSLQKTVLTKPLKSCWKSNPRTSLWIIFHPCLNSDSIVTC